MQGFWGSATGHLYNPRKSENLTQVRLETQLTVHDEGDARNKVGGIREQKDSSVFNILHGTQALSRRAVKKSVPYVCLPLSFLAYLERNALNLQQGTKAVHTLSIGLKSFVSSTIRKKSSLFNLQ